MTRELLTRTPTTAVEIAALCRMLPIEAAAGLIQQYADAAAAAGRGEGQQAVYDQLHPRMRAAVEAPLISEPQFEADLEKVAEEMSR